MSSKNKNIETLVNKCKFWDKQKQKIIEEYIGPGVQKRGNFNKIWLSNGKDKLIIQPHSSQCQGKEDTRYSKKEYTFRDIFLFNLRWFGICMCQIFGT